MTDTGTWSIDVRIFTGDVHTSARADVVEGPPAARCPGVTGIGHAYTKAGGVEILTLGAEIATAHALRDLGRKLMRAAREDVDTSRRGVRPSG